MIYALGAAISAALFYFSIVSLRVAICKDMDFVSLGRALSRGGARIVFLPAWDFVKDGALHARMAQVRGIEGGFSVVRAASEGLLTVSDGYGRVIARDSSRSDREVLLVADAPLGPGTTVYARIGDVFAGASGVLGVALLAWAWRRNRANLSPGNSGVR